jgi:hypothetical protein
MNKQFVQPKLGPDFSFSMAPSLVIRDREEKKFDYESCEPVIKS